jgi:hypothetical protein
VEFIVARAVNGGSLDPPIRSDDTITATPDHATLMYFLKPRSVGRAAWQDATLSSPGRDCNDGPPFVGDDGTITEHQLHRGGPPRQRASEPASSSQASSTPWHGHGSS